MVCRRDSGLQPAPPVGIRGAAARVGVNLEGFASAEVEVGYGEGAEKISATEAGDVTLAVPAERATPGHLLIVYFDESGQVASVFGTALPAGDFAAG